MKILGLILIIVAVAFAFAPAKLNAQGNYVVKLTSPVAGQIVYAGPADHGRVEAHAS